MIPKCAVQNFLCWKVENQLEFQASWQIQPKGRGPFWHSPVDLRTSLRSNA